MTSDRCTSLSMARRRSTRARLWLVACAAVALSVASGAAPKGTTGWTHEAAAKQVPAMYPGFGEAVAANDVGLVAMSSARDHDIGVDAAAVSVGALRRSRFEPAGLARHPQHRSDAGFGMALALDDDNTLYVGAPELDGGAVFIFERPEWGHGPADALWQPVAELRAPSPSTAARFGASIAVWGRGQGRRLVVGEPDRDARSQPGIDGFRVGAAHVFERGGSGWVHAGVLSAPQVATTARFGTSVAIHGDTIVIGAPGASRSVRGRTMWSAGDAWCAHRVDGQWQVLQRLSPPRSHALAYFGYGVGFDGITIAVTALREPMRPDSPSASSSRRGIVHLFEHAGSGWPTDATSRTAPWRPVQRLLPPGPDDEHFAASVSVRDGMVAVGAPAARLVAAHELDFTAGTERAGREGGNAPPPRGGARSRHSNPECGATYVYEKVHANTWVMRARCTAPDAAEGARDGVDVSLARRSDGCIGVVMSRGGDQEGPPGPGAVNAFTPLSMAVSAIPTGWLAGMG
jgi:hypothetical protein